MIQFGLNRTTENDGIGGKKETARGTERGAGEIGIQAGRQTKKQRKRGNG